MDSTTNQENYPPSSYLKAAEPNDNMTFNPFFRSNHVRFNSAPGKISQEDSGIAIQKIDSPALDKEKNMELTGYKSPELVIELDDQENMQTLLTGIVNNYGPYHTGSLSDAVEQVECAPLIQEIQNVQQHSSDRSFGTPITTSSDTIVGQRQYQQQQQSLQIQQIFRTQRIKELRQAQDEVLFDASNFGPSIVYDLDYPASSDENYSLTDISEEEEEEVEEEEEEEEEGSVGISSPIESAKRGKKRLLTPDLHDCKIDTSRIAFDYGKITAPIVRFKELKERNYQRKEFWPFWLHKHFKNGNASLGFPTWDELRLLEKALIKTTAAYEIWWELFEQIFGPTLNWNGHGAMIASVQKLYSFDPPRNSIPDPFTMPQGDQLYISQEFRTIISNDGLIFRFVADCLSYQDFKKSISDIDYVYGPSIADNIKHRIIRWYSKPAKDFYEIWATARFIQLENEGNRPMIVDDLKDFERQKWLEKLDYCKKEEEAISVTEEFFGPLKSIEKFQPALIELANYWNTCNCRICERGRTKRVKFAKDTVIKD